MIDLAQVPEALRATGLEGWLLYDFGGLNPIAREAVLPPERFLTRRWFCLLRADREPAWLVHAIERDAFAEVPGRVTTYARRTELESGLTALLEGLECVAMEYSPMANVPTISRVDGGTVELVRKAGGVKVVSSGDLVQRLLARWPEGALASHLRAARTLEEAVRAAWRRIGERIEEGRPARECEVQGWLVEAMEEGGLETNHPPIVAVGAHAADPHFAPSPESDERIGAECVLLIDLWGREPGEVGTYADITLMAWTGRGAVPESIEDAFLAVRDARDAALELVCARARANEPIYGFEVDRAARSVIEVRGYGAWFNHRTGHSLGREDHWIGAHLDDFETHDDRQLLPGTGFTIEPGVYVPGAFGIRSEIDVFWGKDGPRATTWRQMELERLLSPRP